jgi:signal transduction histidine kinase
VTQAAVSATRDVHSARVVRGHKRRLLAYVLAAIVVALSVLGGVLLGLNQPLTSGNDWFLWGLFVITAAAYVASAVAIVRRQASNPIGWLFFLIGGALVASIVMTEYAVYALRVSPGALPAPGLMLAMAEPTPMLALMGIVLVLQLFPDGRPVSRRWHIVLWLSVAAVAVGTVASMVTPHRIVDIWSDMLSHTGTSAVDPLGVAGLRGVGNVAQNIALLTAVVVSILAVVSLFVRRRRADAIEREQLRWLAFVVGVAAAWIVVVLPLSLIIGSNGWAGALFWIVITPLVALGVPVSVGIAIVRYRLFDIDVVISKTIVYGALAAFITVVYVGIVVGIGQLAGSVATPALSAVAAAIVAIAFQPVRRRVQRVANRFVYGERATPYEVLSGFSEHLAGMYGEQDLLGRMARVLAEGTGATRAVVWLSVGAEIHEAGAWPDAPSAARTLPVAGGALPPISDATRTVEVRHQGDLLGALSVAKPPNDPITPTEDRLLADLASQAGLVLRNVHLIEELRASRTRLVKAQDEERRRIERNIHDGAQQQLVALAVKLKLARSLSAKDVAATDAMLEQLQVEAQEALDDLRDLARGIYPPLLADRGLAAALDAQSRKSPVPVSVRADGIGRFPQEVEAAVYFCALEAMQNIAKYARASSASVRIVRSNGHLGFEVSDDGVGFDPGATGYGTGLQGMADRLDALGGTLSVRSAPGAGTTIEGRLPVADGGGAA